MAYTVYPKINAPFKRDMSKPGRPLIVGDWAIPELEYLADNEWEFTEKVDGTNIRVEIQRVEDSTHVSYRGRSDNADIPVKLLAHLHETFPESSPSTRNEAGDRIGQWMAEHDLTEAVLYGEGYGPGIQNGGNYRDDQSFVLFDVKVGNWWLERDAVWDVAKRLWITSVPYLGSGTIHDAIDLVTDGLRSEWGRFEAEGLVLRPKVQLFDRKGNRIMTKIKGRDFR